MFTSLVLNFEELKKDWNNLSNDIIEGTTPNPILSMRSQRLISTYVSFSFTCMS